MIYFTADLHFYHKRIVELSNRSVSTTKEDHTEWLIDLWNSQVKRNDDIYCLGDFSFHGKYDIVANLTDRLNGNKFLIRGNHDNPSTLRKLEENRKIIKFRDYMEVKICDQSIILFHYPILSFHKQHYGSWHLHGHSHGNLLDSKGKILDVGIDSAYKIYKEYKFFSFEMVKGLMDSKKLHIADSHRKEIVDSDLK